MEFQEPKPRLSIQVPLLQRLEESYYENQAEYYQGPSKRPKLEENGTAQKKPPSQLSAVGKSVHVPIVRATYQSTRASHD